MWPWPKQGTQDLNPGTSGYVGISSICSWSTPAEAKTTLELMNLFDEVDIKGVTARTWCRACRNLGRNLGNDRPCQAFVSLEDETRFKRVNLNVAVQLQISLRKSTPPHDDTKYESTLCHGIYESRRGWTAWTRIVSSIVITFAIPPVPESQRQPRRDKKEVEKPWGSPKTTS